jgi:hypothetical protein
MALYIPALTAANNENKKVPKVCITNSQSPTHGGTVNPKRRVP